MRLFVYGSLKPGGWSSHLLNSKVSNPREGTVQGLMHDCGNYPAVQLTDTNNFVWGIVYDVIEDQKTILMRELDRLEGYPHLFNRVQTYVSLSSDIGAEVVGVAATTYVAQEQSLTLNPIIEDGVWDVETKI